MNQVTAEFVFKGKPIPFDKQIWHFLTLNSLVLALNAWQNLDVLNGFFLPEANAPEMAQPGWQAKAYRDRVLLWHLAQRSGGIQNPVR